MLTDKICLIQNSTGAFFVWQKELKNDFRREFDLKQQYYHFHYPAWILYTWTCLCLRSVSYLFERVPNFAADSALMRASSDLNFLSSNMLQSNTAIVQQCIYLRLPDNSKNSKRYVEKGKGQGDPRETIESSRDILQGLLKLRAT